MISDDLEGMENVILKIEASVGTDVNKVRYFISFVKEKKKEMDGGGGGEGGMVSMHVCEGECDSNSESNSSGYL